MAGSDPVMHLDTPVACAGSPGAASAAVSHTVGQRIGGSALGSLDPYEDAGP